MRITNDVPIAPADTKTKETASGDTFATLLALAGLTTTTRAPVGESSASSGSSGSAASGSDTDPTAAVTETPSGATSVMVLATPPDLAAPLLEIACALEAPAGGAPSLPSLVGPGAVATTDVPVIADQTGADVLDAVRDALASATVTTDDTEGTPPAAPRIAPGTAPTGTASGAGTSASSMIDARGPVGIDAGSPVVPAQTASDVATTAVRLPGTAPVAPDDPAPIDGAIASDASLAPARNGPPVAAAATERPIAPARMSEVMLAAARASAEADRPVRLTVRLDPPNLGEVRVELLARNGSVTVRVEPLHEAAAPLLAHQRQAVSDALGRSGFTMASFDVAPGEPQRERATPTKRTVRVAEATAVDEAPEATTSDAADRLGLRI